MTTQRPNPTPRELLIFVLLWAVFCAAMGLVAAHRPSSMLHAAVFTLVCAMVAILFDAETPVRRRLTSLAIPIVLVALWISADRSSLDPEDPAQPVIMWILIAIGVVGTGAMLAWRSLALRVYRVWTDAAKPIGWTISTLLLALVYFLVFTPLGLVLRALGHDPMQRGFDRGRPSYWSEHPRAKEPSQYFRQF